MAQDVFISYSTLDKTSAEKVCSILEENKISCWIAPRDITPGLDFAEAIIDGINSSKLFILVYSSNSNNSKQVIREVDRAVHAGLPIINLRLEDVLLSKQLEYYLSGVHWFDAMNLPLEKHIHKLSGVVKILLKKDDSGNDNRQKSISYRSLRGGLDKKFIAVLPFKNMSNDPDQEYFSDGMMEEILDRLVKIGDMKVISRTSSMHYKNTDKSIKEIARELGVASVIEGSVRRAGNMVRIAVQLIDAGTDTHLWSEIYNGNLSDLSRIFLIQGEVAQSVAKELKAIILPEEKRIIEKIPTGQPGAYDAYLKGKFHIYNLISNDDINLDTSMKFFELAKEIDPEFALAYAGMANVWMFRQQMGLASPEEAGPKITVAVERALELDSTLPEVHYMLANNNYLATWNWEAAESAYKKVFEINPNHPEAHALYSHLLFILGRNGEAIEHAELSLKLDPHNPWIITWYSAVLLFDHRYDECILICREFYDKNPTTFWSLMLPLSIALHMKEEFDESFEAYKLAISFQYKDFNHVFDQYEKLGYTGTLNLEADTLLVQSKTKYLSQADIATTYSFATNKEGALDCLEQAYEMRDPVVPYIGVFPNYSVLSAEPRFKELLRKLNLPLLSE
jgi:TolB-like protein